MIENSNWELYGSDERLTRTKDELMREMEAFAKDLATNEEYRGKRVICVSHAAAVIALVRGFGLGKKLNGKEVVNGLAQEVKDDDATTAVQDLDSVAIDGGYRVRTGVCSCNILRRADSESTWTHEYRYEYLSAHERDWQFHE